MKTDLNVCKQRWWWRQTVKQTTSSKLQSPPRNWTVFTSSSLRRSLRLFDGIILGEYAVSGRLFSSSSLKLLELWENFHLHLHHNLPLLSLSSCSGGFTEKPKDHYKPVFLANVWKIEPRRAEENLLSKLDYTSFTSFRFWLISNSVA